MKLIIDVPEKLTCEGFERPFTEEEKNILIKAIGNGIPLDKVLDKIREEIKDNTYFINETTEKEGVDFEIVEKIIDKYRDRKRGMRNDRSISGNQDKRIR